MPPWDRPPVSARPVSDATGCPLFFYTATRFNILQALVTNVEPSAVVKNALNNVEAAVKERVAQETKAKAAHFVAVKKAEVGTKPVATKPVFHLASSPTGHRHRAALCWPRDKMTRRNGRRGEAG